jgi:hypothetical protein
MTVFEKYEENLREKEALEKIIKQLCMAYIMNEYNDSDYKRLVKFVGWEIPNPCVRTVRVTIILEYLKDCEWDNKKAGDTEEKQLDIHFKDLLIQTEY